MRIAVAPEPSQSEYGDMQLFLMDDEGGLLTESDLSYEDARRVAVALLQELVRNGVHGVAPVKYADGGRQFVVTL